MVTAGFYDRSRLGLWLFEVMGRQWDLMSGWSENLIHERFPGGATWSLPIWEFMYGFEPDDTLSLEERRQRVVLRKMTGNPPISPARVEAVLSALTGGGVTVTEDVAPYTFRVEFHPGPPGDVLEAALRLLREIKPSHLSFQVVQRPVIVTRDFYAGVVQEIVREVIVDS